MGVLAHRIGPESLIIGLVRRGGGDGLYRGCNGHGDSIFCTAIAVVIAMVILVSTLLGRAKDGAFGTIAITTATAIATIGRG